MKILITGDLVVNTEYDTFNIDNSVISLFEGSDINIVNLEAPITDNINEILKTGPNIKSDRSCTIAVLKALRIDVATLANNHILDYGEVGVNDTLDFCKEQNIKTVGAGMNLHEASTTLFLDTIEGSIAIVNFAENEWANATENSSGANPMDIIDNANQIKKAREKADYVIVIVHGGHEYYNLPSPRMQKQYRYYADQGADVIVGHHTHCISGSEVWNDVPIYYSLGNFLFTHKSILPDWYLGLILEIEIIDNELITRLLPMKQSSNKFKLSLLNSHEKENINKRINQYSMIISDSKLLKEEWDSYVESKSEQYLKYWSPLSFINNKYIYAIVRRLPIKFFNRKGALLFLNLMRCESHRDLSVSSIKKYL